jgi:hypothetical protein
VIPGITALPSIAAGLESRPLPWRYPGAMDRAGWSCLLLVACGASPGTTQPRSLDPVVLMPGPGRARGVEALRVNRACEGCHRDAAREWRESLHGAAHTDPVYQRAFAREPLAFCQSCHAPEAPLDEAPASDVLALGVGCVTCHVTDGAVLAAPRAGPGGETAPHPVLREARFASAGACASCHEFAFPDSRPRSEPLLMQSTLSEHRASEFAATSCAECHMPRDGQRRSHRFRASRDAAFVRSALDVTATRLGDGRVELALAPKRIGHAFPTGDLFRRLALEVEAVGPEQQVVAERTRYLARHFRREPSGGALERVHLLADDRVTRGTRLVLDLGSEARALPIAWRVAYQRVEHPAGVGARDAVVEGEIVLSDGLFPAAKEPR